MSTNLGDRRFPRATVSVPCVVEEHATGRLMSGRMWSATCEGFGLDTADLLRGGALRVTFRVGDAALAIPAKVVWQHDDGETIRAGAAMTLAAAPDDVPPVYARWLVDQIRDARGEAVRLGGILAVRRMLSLRTLQDLLDAHAIVGGSFSDTLRNLELHAVADALDQHHDKVGAAHPTTVTLPPPLLEWAELWGRPSDPRSLPR